MAHKFTVIEPADGLTVLAGPNNCGKSAVVEALLVLASNSGKDFMTRHGETECRIMVETSEGHTIEWRRKSGVVSYHLNGRAVHRMKRSVPDELDGLLKLPEVPGPDGKESFAVHFGTQKEPIFLLDRSGRHTATFFASFSDASRLVAMQMAHKKKVADRRAEERVLAERERQLARSLASLEPIPQLSTTLQELEATHDSLHGEIAAITTMETQAATMKRQTQAVLQARERAATLSDLSPLPALVDTAPLEQLLTHARCVDSTIAHETARGRALVLLDAPPHLEETRELQNLCRNLARQQGELESQAARTVSLSPLTGPPTMAPVEPLADMCGRMHRQINVTVHSFRGIIRACDLRPRRQVGTT